MPARKFRKRRGTWFPNLGTIQPNGTTRENADASRSVALLIRGDGGISQIVIPITFDAPLEADSPIITTDTPLGSFLQNEYFLERIVGNLFISMRQRVNNNAGDVTPGGVYVAAAFFVARTEDEAIDNDLPVGAGASTAAEIANYCPLNDVNIREPWLFRRTWLLGNQSSVVAGTVTEFTVGLPPNNLYSYPGGSMSGPFIDARTKRRIKSDDRLWFVLAARNWPINETSDGLQNLDEVRATLDYRIYGSLRKARPGGTF